MRFRKYISKEEAKKIWPDHKYITIDEVNKMSENCDFTVIDPEILALTQEKIIAHLLQEQLSEE